VSKVRGIPAALLAGSRSALILELLLVGIILRVVDAVLLIVLSLSAYVLIYLLYRNWQLKARRHMNDAHRRDPKRPSTVCLNYETCIFRRLNNAKHSL